MMVSRIVSTSLRLSGLSGSAKAEIAEVSSMRGYRVKFIFLRRNSYSVCQQFLLACFDNRSQRRKLKNMRNECEFFEGSYLVNIFRP